MNERATSSEMRLVFLLRKPLMRFPALFGWDWSVSESSDTSPRSLTLEALPAPLTAVRGLTSLSCPVPPAEVAAVLLCVLSESADFPAFLIKSTDLLLLCLREACPSASLAFAESATGLPCSLITILGISLSFISWPSLLIRGTIFPIRAGFGVLGIIFPTRGFAAREWSETWGDFTSLSNVDLEAVLEVFCGCPFVVPNPAKSSSWRKTNRNMLNGYNTKDCFN